MEGALKLHSLGKDYGATGIRTVSVPWMGSGAAPVDRGGVAIAVAPSHCFTYRKIRLPQANARVHRRIVQEELTFSLPFPLHQCVWDYYLQPGPEAFAVVAQSSRWQTLAARWGAVQGSEPEPLCYLRAALHGGVHDALIIDWGASHTTFVAITGGKIDWVRTMMRGGQAMSQALADESRVPFTEAEDLKRRRGTELPAVTAFLKDVIDEMLLPKPLPHSQVLLCGGGSSLPGLRAYLHSQLGIEPQPFPLPPMLSPYQHVSAFGAALAGRPGSRRMRLQNLREVPASATLNSWMTVAAAALVLWVAGLEMRHQGLRQQQQQLRSQFRPTAQSMGVQIPPNLKTPAEAEKWLAEQQAFRRSVRASSVGAVGDAFARAAQGLREVGGSHVVELIFDEGKVTLEGDAESPVQLQQLRLKWQQVFPDLRQTMNQKSAGDRFHFRYEGKMPQS